MEKIKVNTHGNKLPEAIENGDWIDLRSAETVTMEAGEYRVISLGISMKLPEGYEAYVVPRNLADGLAIIALSNCRVMRFDFRNDSCPYFPSWSYYE